MRRIELYYDGRVKIIRNENPRWEKSGKWYPGKSEGSITHSSLRRVFNLIRCHDDTLILADEAGICMFLEVE